MPTRDNLREELDWASAKISSQIWVLNLGMLGTTWSLLLSGAAADKSGAVQLRFSYLEARSILVLCILGLCFDLAQYLSGYVMAIKKRNEMNRLGRDTFEYDPKECLWRLRNIFFWSKIVVTGLAAALLIAILFPKLG